MSQGIVGIVVMFFTLDYQRDNADIWRSCPKLSAEFDVKYTDDSTYPELFHFLITYLGYGLKEMFSVDQNEDIKKNVIWFIVTYILA